MPHYELIIDEDVFKFIRKKAEYFFFTGLSKIGGEKKHWHDARFLHKNRTYEVKIKLRGLCRNHYEPNHMSFRVRFRKDDLFEGKRNIDLVGNYDKGFFLLHIMNEDIMLHGGAVKECRYTK